MLVIAFAAFIVVPYSPDTGTTEEQENI